ncbi:MAG: prolyl oligopeptidase family serine peptidase [Verrucomicrobiales bacterium]|nr:prolyl oligopeptidase family serine peptidase [Verrucomicrobiales bacterium]
MTFPSSLATLALALSLPLLTCLPAKADQQSVTFEKARTGTDRLEYLLSLPEGYDKDPAKKWPLVVFLHGSGERGSDISRVKTHGPPMLVEKGKNFPFILISPQCPKNSTWSDQPLIELIEDAEKRYQVDPKRIILTGLSMGGYGTWNLATRYPNKFAALVPLCGGGTPYLTRLIKNTPIWVFHGAKDGAVDIGESQRMVDALKKNGSKQVKFTIYPEAGHNCWTETYNNEKLYQWMTEQKLP